MSGKYILNGKIPVLCDDLMKWGHQFQNSNRIVAKETIGESKVSTVFLTLDHNWGEGEPVLWETMVFGGPLDEEQDRCSGTWEDAEAMHKRMVERIKSRTHE